MSRTCKTENFSEMKSIYVRVYLLVMIVTYVTTGVQYFAIRTQINRKTFDLNVKGKQMLCKRNNLGSSTKHACSDYALYLYTWNVHLPRFYILSVISASNKYFKPDLFKSNMNIFCNLSFLLYKKGQINAVYMCIRQGK